jgi:hypothetical protein
VNKGLDNITNQELEQFLQRLLIKEEQLRKEINIKLSALREVCVEILQILEEKKKRSESQ